MTLLNKVPYYQLTALIILTLAASLFSLNLAIGTLIAGLIIIPEFLYTFLAKRILASKDARLGQAIRLRLLKLISSIAFIALSIKLLSNYSTDVAIAWIITVCILFMLPMLTLMKLEQNFKNKEIKVQ